MSPVSRIFVLDVPIDPLDGPALFGRIGGAIREGRRITVGYANAHVLDLSARDPKLRRFLQGLDVCYADGRGVRHAARLLGLAPPPRITGADLVGELAARSVAGGWRVAWIGGEYGVAAEATRRLGAEYTGFSAVFTDHGYPRVPEEGRIAALNAARPDVVLIGLGTPLQERYVERWRGRIEAPVVWMIGGAADFASGRTPRGPAWLHARQEWLARLIVEPRRLGGRYLVGGPRFLGRILASALG